MTGKKAPSVNSEINVRFINREIGLLKFQERVLEEATDPTNPLLERIKFLAILGSNLDELFMVRVGGLVMQKRSGVYDLSVDGLTAAEQLVLIRKYAVELMDMAWRHWSDTLRPELATAGIHILNHADLNEKQRAQAQTFYEKAIFPVLTPQALDPGHPFPHISNLSLNLAVVIRDRNGEERFARVKVPSTLPRLVPLKKSSGGERKDGTVPHKHYFVWLEQVIVAHLDLLFPGMEIVEAHPFRVTRNADIAVQEIEAADLLATMTESVLERQFSPVINLALDKTMPKRSRAVLTANLLVDPNDVYTWPSPLGLSGLMQLYDIERWDLKYHPFTPAVPPELSDDHAESDIFTTIRSGDVLLHHPYECFDPVIDFVKSAARDPDVLAIKQTLYRVGPNSPVVKYLLEARKEHRKQVTVLVELKARFDEESNIGWAKMLERAGVHVIYGMVGLKTHAKLLLVIRKEGDALRRYVHLGTGNYNYATARIYEDVGLFTCDDAVGADATNLFNYLTGYSYITDFNRLLVAPLTLRQRFDDLIEREIEHARAGREAHLVFKCNALVDETLITRLYEASAAGVKVDLILRGICSLRSQVPGLSENIRVRSIVGRFLEHSRIYYFHNGGQEEIFLGSADLMTRNIDRRVETLFPVSDPAQIRRLRDFVLHANLSDNVKSRLQQPDGEYERCELGPDAEALESQAWLLSHYTRNATK